MAAADILTKVVRSTSGARPVVTVTVSRPSKLNSLNSNLLNLLAREMNNIPRKHPDLLTVILTGQGHKSFIGGADITEMAALNSSAAAREFITRVHKACKSIRDCPVPVIGRINGYTLGAGLEVAASCDFRVGLIRWGRTRRLLMLGDNISSVEALQWGLIEKVVEADRLDHAVDEWVRLLERSGPLAVRRQKKLIQQWKRLGLDGGIEAGIPAFGESFEGDGEGPNMLSDFVERRHKGQ
ncbi:ClpP/crotonase-like domain-containing protein [Aspergillus lucknowensis]|uniref:ClpP/crotonase-like domain-containing protein n=1 Tax=Aspergillus lucknowensis TaxID=176173 RepID=A0ABR4LS72_9EURO